ncbi:MAG TPA: hypothetical protein VK907_07165 [Phnomibacter sp.]|nr:hypothetical protein [Phnomibacter sp.]
MKKFYIPAMCIICILLTTIEKVEAQMEDSWTIRRLYLTGSMGKDAYLVQFNVHFDNRWMAFVSWEDGNIKSKNRPDDYDPGASGGFFGGSGSPSKAMDFDEYAPFSLGIGRVITPPSDRAWITAIGGIVAGKYSERLFAPYDPVPPVLFFGRPSNYITDLDAKTMLGVKIGLQGNLNLSRYLGLAGGIQTLVTNQRVIPNFTLGLNLGLMRPSRANMIR